MASALFREASMLWRGARSAGGIRWAIVRRVRDLTGITALEARLEEIVVTGTAPDELVTGSHSAQVTSEHLPTERDDVAEFNRRLNALEAANRREIFTAWASSVPLRRAPLVTVILATLGERPVALEQAVRSILSQSYAHI